MTAFLKRFHEIDEIRDNQGPVTVAESFSVLKRIKNYLRSTMCQMLGTLAVETELAKQLEFNEIIETFANKKARKAAVGTPYN